MTACLLDLYSNKWNGRSYIIKNQAITKKINKIRMWNIYVIQQERIDPKDTGKK